MVSLGVGILFGFGAPSRAPALAPPQRSWAQQSALSPASAFPPQGPGLRHLGLSPFEEGFYMPPGSRAWLIQKTGPFTTIEREYTLEEARCARVL
jgi:hypothetical protein